MPLLLNELAAEPRPAILVLDDYQAVTNPDCHELLALFIERLPATLHLVVATRIHPPIPLARLWARGQLAELGAADLRFTLEEAAALLNDRLELLLDRSDVAMLHQCTEGWPAGLYLAAEALGGGGDRQARVASFSGSDRHVLDYLGEELLRAQPPELQRFLTHTSILERQSAPLCEAVTGTSGAAATLRRLERENLLVVPLDRARSWYRYHHLFADMLQHELTASEPALVPELHGAPAPGTSSPASRPTPSATPPPPATSPRSASSSPGTGSALSTAGGSRPCGPGWTRCPRQQSWTTRSWSWCRPGSRRPPRTRLS